MCPPIIRDLFSLDFHHFPTGIFKTFNLAAKPYNEQSAICDEYPAEDKKKEKCSECIVRCSNDWCEKKCSQAIMLAATLAKLR